MDRNEINERINRTKGAVRWLSTMLIEFEKYGDRALTHQIRVMIEDDGIIPERRNPRFKPLDLIIWIERFRVRNELLESDIFKRDTIEEGCLHALDFIYREYVLD